MLLCFVPGICLSPWSSGRTCLDYLYLLSTTIQLSVQVSRPTR